MYRLKWLLLALAAYIVSASDDEDGPDMIPLLAAAILILECLRNPETMKKL
jgi:hypothetical protein